MFRHDHVPADVASIPPPYSLEAALENFPRCSRAEQLPSPITTKGDEVQTALVLIPDRLRHRSNSSSHPLAPNSEATTVAQLTLQFGKGCASPPVETREFSAGGAFGLASLNTGATRGKRTKHRNVRTLPATVRVLACTLRIWRLCLCVLRFLRQNSHSFFVGQAHAKAAELSGATGDVFCNGAIRGALRVWRQFQAGVCSALPTLCQTAVP